MNDQEKRALAVQRELSELRAVADSFGELVGQAHRLNDELRASFARLDRLRKEDELAQKIDEADYQAKRGKYAYLRVDPEGYMPDDHGDAFRIEPHIYHSLVAAGYHDASWRNDICPRFQKPVTHEGRPDGRDMVIWIDAKEVADRESEEPRFGVHVMDEGETVAILCATDNFQVAFDNAEEWLRRADSCSHPFLVEGICYRCKKRVLKHGV